MEHLQPYNGVTLVAEEIQTLEELESEVNAIIPPLDIKNLETAKFGFYYENNRILEMHLHIYTR